MARRRRRRRYAEVAQEGQQPAEPSPTPWNWRTFPVFFAFALGVFLMALVGGPDTIVGVVLFYASLLGVSFGLAHIFGRWLARRRARRAAGGR